MLCRSLVCLVPLVFASTLPAAEPVDAKSPVEPAAAQQLFQLADANLRIELAAAEPEVIDPVAIRFDEDGRMWVCEMRDYPTGPPPGSGKTSRIRVLEDADGDGRFEKSTTFADGLSFVTGLQPWKGGVFVTLSGAVAYMQDTDGDGKCDHDETWFEGFAEQNTQLRANHPRLALDNWIYVANGLRGGKVVSRKLKDQPTIDISGMDFRFDPLTGKAEAVSGNGQFGLTFDDWGNRFICSNRNPCMHVVIEDRYLKANPAVTVPAVVHNVAAFAENSRIYPISRAWTTSNLHAGQFTAACGVYIYRGDALPKEFYGNVFTCDPTGNLIHREIMQPSGPTFTSKPAYEGKEFLASPDEWFRPVNMELGPDGALYVVDMYRAVIEHPDWVPDELKRRPDERFGDDRGRIWRIVSAGTPPLPLGEGQGEGADTNPKRQRGSAPGLSQATSNDLLPLLGHANAWHRETAQRLLLERQRQALAPKLRELAASSDNPQVRARSLWLLTATSQLEGDDVRGRLADADPQVKVQALMHAEQMSGFLDVQSMLPAFTNDSNALVRFQSRLSGVNSPGLFDRFDDLDDPWMRAAIRLKLKPQSAAAGILRLFRREREQRVWSPELLDLLTDLGRLTQESPASTLRKSALHEVLVHIVEQPEPVAGVAVLKGFLRSTRPFPKPETEPAEPTVAQAAARLSEIAKDDRAPAALRIAAIETISYIPEMLPQVLEYLDRDHDQAVRISTIQILARLPLSKEFEPLLQGFSAETPPVRRAIVDGLLTNTERTKLLLDAIDAGKIKPSELDAAHVTRLSQHKDAAIKERAGKLFAAATPAERAKALADYQVVLTMAADAKRGQAIFEKNCAACHKIAGIGTDVAPDISDSRTKKLDQLLGDILLPNRAIDNNYIGYNVRLLDGTVATGILKTETSTSITLRQQGGKESVIPRTEIEELKSSGQSLMPEGLERQIPQQEMADLLSFIKNWRYLDGRTPLSPR